MTAIVYRAVPAPADADRRIAIDGNGLPYPVIVEDGIVYDADLWPFEELRRAIGCPVDQMTFRSEP